MSTSAESNPPGELSIFVRYLLCGATATLCHFAVLVIGVEVIGIDPIGAANALAAVIGSVVAFLGNRYFTFRASGEQIGRQFIRFATLYAGGALWHGIGLYLWSDVEQWDYRVGFVVVTALQIIGIYLGNRFFVFRQKSRL